MLKLASASSLQVIKLLQTPKDLTITIADVHSLV